MPIVTALASSQAQNAKAAKSGATPLQGGAETGGDVLSAFLASLEAALEAKGLATDSPAAPDAAATGTRLDPKGLGTLIETQGTEGSGDAVAAIAADASLTPALKAAKILDLLGLTAEAAAGSDSDESAGTEAGADTAASADTSDSATLDATVTDLGLILALLARGERPPTPSAEGTADLPTDSPVQAAPGDTAKAPPVQPDLPEIPVPATTDAAPAEGADTSAAPAAAATLAGAAMATGDAARAPATTTDAAPAAAAPAPVALQADRAQPRRPTPLTRTEERMKKIADEIAQLTGRSTPVTVKGVSETSAAPVARAVPAATPAAVPVTDAAANPAATPSDALRLAARTATAQQPAADPAAALASATEIAAPKPADPLGLAPLPPTPAIQTVTAAPPPAPIPVAVPLDGLASTIAAHAARRDTRFEIRLDPAELGRVDVTLDVRHDGTVKAHLVVERSETLDMMMRDQQGLTRALEQSGLQVASGGLEFSLQQQGRDHRQPTGEARPAAPRDEEPAPPEVPLAAAAYSRAGPGGLDVRI